jgi:hypothetical protein
VNEKEVAEDDLKDSFFSSLARRRIKLDMKEIPPKVLLKNTFRFVLSEKCFTKVRKCIVWVQFVSWVGTKLNVSVKPGLGKIVTI